MISMWYGGAHWFLFPSLIRRGGAPSGAVASISHGVWGHQPPLLFPKDARIWEITDFISNAPDSMQAYSFCGDLLAGNSNSGCSNIF